MSLAQVNWRLVSGVALAWVALIAFAFAFVDRPVALFAHEHLRDPFIARIGGQAIFESFTYIAAVVEPLALWGLAAIGFAALSGWKSSSWARLFIAAALAALVADAAKDELKLVFGRVWPEPWIPGSPSLIGTGTFGFFPFHGGQGWGSFPSGHTSMIGTPMAVLWFARPRLRWLAVLLTGLVIVGLVGLDYHFVSDCLAGLGLATAVGGAAAILFRLIPAG